MTPNKLAAQWLELFNTTTSKPTKNKAFMAKHGEIDREYRELSAENQAKFTRLINRATKEILPWHSTQ